MVGSGGTRSGGLKRGGFNCGVKRWGTLMEAFAVVGTGKGTRSWGHFGL